MNRRDFLKVGLVAPVVGLAAALPVRKKDVHRDFPPEGTRTLTGLGHLEGKDVWYMALI